MLSSYSSSTALLETFVLLSPGSPRFSVAGRLSYSMSSNSPHAFFSPPSKSSPEPESDIGLQSPRTIAAVCTIPITHANLVASSRTPPIPSRAHRRASRVRHSSSSFRRRDATDGRCASISQILATDIDEALIEICPRNLFKCGQATGLGLSIQIPLPTPKPTARCSSEEDCIVVPIIDVAPGSLATASSEDNRSIVPVARSMSSESSLHPLGVKISSQSCSLSVDKSAVPATVPSPPSTEQVFSGIGLGLGEPGAPQEEDADGADADMIAKEKQHVQLGLGLPSTFREREQAVSKKQSVSSPAASPTATNRTTKARVQSTNVQDRKRTLFVIPETQATKPAALNLAIPTNSSSPTAPPSLSPVMLAAAQSILAEDRKFRKKEGLGNRNASPTMNKLVEQVKAEEKKKKMEKGKGGRRFKFMF
ncbi:hypothetical protein MKEN_00713600 [Mycena kentingensis (nom. inval.)]|nr:hypothetical protein MKEN_00713600 [Mycena kentingensis (nom. inval.)]